MKLERKPLTNYFEMPVHEVTLYQTINRSFFDDIIDGYTPLACMEDVYSTLMRGDKYDILDECSRMFNDDEQIDHFLNYSMSVGDVVSIDDEFFRFIHKGWLYIGGGDIDAER